MKLNEIIDSCIRLSEDITKDYTSILNDSVIELFSMVNHGRDNIASKFCKTAIFTTIKDERRCKKCKSLQGKRFVVGSNEYYENNPPLHNRCRCIYTYILERNY